MNKVFSQTSAVSPIIVKELKDGQIRIASGNRHLGSCAIAPIVKGHSRARENIGNLHRLRKGLGVGEVLMMMPEFTNVIGEVTDAALPLDETHRLNRLFRPTDALVVTALDANSGVAVGIANADCPIGIMYSNMTSWYALLHLGYKCLVPPAGGADIISLVGQQYPGPIEELKLFVSWGAGPCCYGWETASRELPRLSEIGFELGQKVVYRGPRIGQQAVDLYALIEHLARPSFGDRLVIERICTSCAGVAREDDGLDVRGDYFSNLRGDSEPPDYKGRNGLLVARDC